MVRIGYSSRYQRRPVKRRRSAYPSRGIRSVRGRGAYWQDVGKLALNRGGQFVGGAVGSLAGPVGMTVGSTLGGYAGDHISKAVGLGAYSVQTNSLMIPEGQQVPAFGDLGDVIVIKHREFVQDISVPGTPGVFTNAGFVLNPGLSTVFPWLSTIASSFESYMWLGMIWEFKSTSADIGSVSTLGMGTVIMGTDYDPQDALYATKLEMENAQYTTSAKPSESFVHCIECDPSVNPQPHLYIRTGGIAAGEDARFYDHGVFQLATAGLPTGSSGTLGELWCTYQVAFFKPQIRNLPTALLGYWHTAISWDNSNRWGLVIIPDAQNNLNVSISGNVLTIPQATIGEAYQITIDYNLSVAQAPAGGLLQTTSNCTIARLRQIVGGGGANANLDFFSDFFINVTGPNPAVTLSNLTDFANKQLVSISVTRVFPGVAS